MKKNVLDLIYLNTKKYISLNQMSIMLLVFIPLLSDIVLCSVYAGQYIYAIIAGILFLSYIVWMLLWRSSLVKKTFRLRFLTNGIACMYMIAFVCGFFFTIICISTPSFIDKLPLVVGTYCVFLVLYVLLIVLGVHTGAFTHLRNFGKSKVAIVLTCFFVAILPWAVLLGKCSAGQPSDSFSDEKKMQYVITAGIAVLYMLSVGYINFVQYAYCLKYNINCDEKGVNRSARLEPVNKDVYIVGEVKDLRPRKPITFVKILKIIMFVLLGLVGLFVLLFIVLVIRAIIINA